MQLMFLFFLTISLPLLVSPATVHAADTIGPARVVDGDTIHIGETKIRLHGIDAPEMKQTCKTKKGREQLCGQLAKQSLAEMVRGQEVRCEGDERDRYGRLIAVCYVGPFNINERMVADGWALAYRQYSKDYVRAEEFAKARKEGMWRTEFVPPWEWHSITTGQH
jgi:endonuclease YncB( thermonuclease family)